MADLIPGALVLRFLLTPHDVIRVRIGFDDGCILLDRERIKLLDAHQPDIPFFIDFAGFEKIVKHFTAAEDDPIDLRMVLLAPIRDDELKLAC